MIALIALSTAYYSLYGPFEAATSGYVRGRLGAGAGTYGLLWTLFGLGAVATLPLAPSGVILLWGCSRFGAGRSLHGGY